MSLKRAITTYDFQPAVKLEKGDIVWVAWNHYRHGDSGEQATPTRVIKVYDDGNIIHHKTGYGDKEFAWATDIIAKSPGIPFAHMPYRTMKVADIRKRMRDLELEEADNECDSKRTY